MFRDFPQRDLAMENMPCFLPLPGFSELRGGGGVTKETEEAQKDFPAWEDGAGGTGAPGMSTAGPAELWGQQVREVPGSRTLLWNSVFSQ